MPESARMSLLEIAHEGVSGHLGIHKTYHKLLHDFYWPNMKKDVTNFVNTCHTYQVVGKPNLSIPPYPLQPLSKTKKGNQYILTVMCPSIRYPEAFPLKNISAKNIVKHLTKMFTSYGIPQEIQSDRGTNFTSKLFTDVLNQIRIKQTLSTVTA